MDGTYIQSGLLLVAILTLVISIRNTRRIARRETYQRLEYASIDLFRFEMKHSDKTWRLYDPSYDLDGAPGKDRQEIINHATQILNLFEMCVELRNRKIVDAKIYSTWVKWFFEIGTLENFGKIWEELKLHYTGDLHDILNELAKGNKDWDQFIQFFRRRDLEVAENLMGRSKLPKPLRYAQSLKYSFSRLRF